jgi:rhodanese-related sulfurtransferase
MAVRSISPQQLSEINQQSSVQLIDVRTPAEYHEVHIPFAKLPWNQVGSHCTTASASDL